MDRKFRLGSGLVLAALVVLSASSCGKLQARRLGISPPEYKVEVERDVMIPMRDGVNMAADIYFPAGVEKAPAILVRTPYGKRSFMNLLQQPSTTRLLAQRGYVVIVMDVRGRYDSGGEFYPFVNDGLDGFDTIAWIEDQQWFNGMLGTYGGSYLGTTQWFGAPGRDIDAMHLMVTSPNLKEVMYRGGQLHLMTVFNWSIAMGEKKMDLRMAAKMNKVEKLVYSLPLSEADDEAGRDVIYFDQALDPEGILDTYEQVRFDNKYRQVSAPSVFVAGWYDMFVGPQLDDFVRILEEGEGKAKESILIVGPWAHGMQGGDGSVDFGKEVKQRKALGPAHILDWFDYRLKGADTGADNWPRVRIFVMGENVWRDENEWPLERTRYTRYYLHSDGSANTRSGHGVLSIKSPAKDEPPDRFVYDPLDPVPTLGGNNLGINIGPYDQSGLEDRQDVLCYTTPALEEDVEVTGPIQAVLYAASDAVDTDFTVKLVDVHPDGKAVNIQDGIARAMYRDNDPENPTPLVPGAVEEYRIDLWATSNVFKTGHRIRVEVSSSNFPRYNRNLNTGEPIPDATRTVAANQTVFHDEDHQSHIVLPIIPR